MQHRPGFIQAAALAFASRFAAAPHSRSASRSRGAHASSSRARSMERTPAPERQASSDVAGSRGADARGVSADEPTQIPARGWKEILGRVWVQIGKDRVLAVAAGVTFYALLAIFPMITAIVS